jgi:hypothetical protein
MIIPYVQSSASQEVPPPYYFPGVTVNAFIWEAQMDRVEAYCERFFNLGTTKERGFVYKPVPMWPYAMLLFMDYPTMISTASQSIAPEPEYSERGYVQQSEVFIAFPVIRFGTTPANLMFATTIEWAIPFIVVGNAMSAVCGREMVGLRKLLAKIELERGPFPGSFKGCVGLPGWPTPDGKQKEEPFLKVDTAPTLPTYRGNPTSSIWSLFQSREAGWGFDEIANAANGLNQLTSGLTPNEMRTVSLKQIRDAEYPTKALYQALVSCLTRYSNVREFKFYNERDVSITFSTAGSFRHVLELFHDIPPDAPTAVRHALKPKAAFQFMADIDFGDMRTIHTFGVDRGPGLTPVRASSDLAAPWARPWLGLFRGARR